MPVAGPQVSTIAGANGMVVSERQTREVVKTAGVNKNVVAGEPMTVESAGR